MNKCAIVIRTFKNILWILLKYRIHKIINAKNIPTSKAIDITNNRIPEKKQKLVSKTKLRKKH